MSKHKYNLRKDEFDERDYLFKNTFSITTLPQSVDLRPKMPPVYDQGQLGSCQSFASGSIKEYLDFCKYVSSKLFIYYNARQDKNEDTGSTLREVCDALKKCGAAEEKYWGYDINRYAEKPTQEAYDNGKLHTISSYHRVTTINEMKQALAMGLPILLGIKIYENFQSEECMNTGVVPSPKGQLVGGHAVVGAFYETEKPKASIFKCLFNKLTGKQSSSDTFIFRNSWGDGVGLPDSKGYFKISADVLQKLLMDAWVIVK